MRRVLITGSSGLVGSECVRHFDRLGCATFGFDGNQRKAFFGGAGDTTPTLRSLVAECAGFKPIKGDVRDRQRVRDAVEEAKPDLVIHAAAQPSHDWATSNPFDDFDVNAVGTLNLLEAVRQCSPVAAFVFLSTNKVYGDAPNERSLTELDSRFDFSDPCLGFDETVRLDYSRHSLFGASKAAADLLVQEYGRTFGLNTVCFRCGCLTGSAHAGTEQHGFLSHLVRCVKAGQHYKVFGFKGKQVRDQLHAKDVATACELFAKSPRAAEIYNLGGGKENSVSVIEAIGIAETMTRKSLSWEDIDRVRGGDHCVYYSDCSKFKLHYGWEPSVGLIDIFADLCGDN